MPMALSSSAGPSRIIMVTKALRQNHGLNDERVTVRNSFAPAHRAAATIHNTSIHRFASIERPPQISIAIHAPINVDPTISRPAERAWMELACWPSITDFMTIAT